MLRTGRRAEDAGWLAGVIVSSRQACSTQQSELWASRFSMRIRIPALNLRQDTIIL